MSENVAYTASGTLSLTSPVAYARTEAGGPAAPYALGSWSVYTDIIHPNTGKSIEGFHWDERVWYQEEQENISQILPTNWDPTISGITTTYFQPGIGSGQDLELESIEFYPTSGFLADGLWKAWSPVVRHGYYYDYDEEAYMYSDDSEVVYITKSGVVPSLATEKNRVQLLSVPKVGAPIRADRYLWDNTEGKYYIDLSVRKKAQLTGLRDSDMERQDTWSDRKQTILWELVDDLEPEFVVVDSGNIQTIPWAIFNQQFVDQYPSTSAYEALGISTGASTQQYHTTYAPIDSTMPVQVYSYLAVGGTWTAWEALPVSGIWTAGSNQVKVDYDLGVLDFGDLTISGVNTPSAGHTLVTNYWRSLRVEYEPEWSVDTVIGHEVNINPIYRTSGRGFVLLSTRADDVTALTLEASAPYISTDRYGPIYLGTAYVPIIATATDSRDLPVEGASVDITITTEPAMGRFGSFGDSVTSITNHIGQAKGYYNPPSSITEIGEYVTASGFAIDNTAMTTTLTVEDLLIESDTTKITVYQVLSNDPVQGWFSPYVASDETSQAHEYYREYFEDEDIYGPTGLTSGVLTNLGGSRTAAEWEETHRDAWNLTQMALLDQTTSLYGGKKVLCATYRDNVYNPHTFTFGAVAPFQPTTISTSATSGFDLIFDTSEYSLPYPSGSLTTSPSGIIHSYFVVAPSVVSMQASTYNSRLNQTIYSNTIQLTLDIPTYLNGMWYIDAINQTHLDEVSSLLASGIVTGSGVPLGFRLRSSSVTLASALDGVTFLDVNPTYNAPIWEATEPFMVGSGVIASGIPYAQHMFTVSGVV